MASLDVDAGLHPLCFETLANELRLDIIRLLDEHREMNVTLLAEETGAERSRVSHALQILRKCQIATMKKRGREAIYALNKEAPFFKKSGGNIFDRVEAHARACPHCPRYRKRGAKR